MRTKKSILLVEDDEVDVLTVRRALRQLGVPNPLVVAANGEQALEILRQAAGERGSEGERPALIFLDLNMPRMNGIEFLRQARAEGCAEGIPIIVLTTSRQQQDVIDGFQYNVAGYMIKPVEYEEFVEVMQAIDSYWTLSEMPT
ncbi:MAG: response regulator [Acidobacteriota bacterium]